MFSNRSSADPFIVFQGIQNDLASSNRNVHQLNTSMAWFADVHEIKISWDLFTVCLQIYRSLNLFNLQCVYASIFGYTLAISFLGQKIEIASFWHFPTDIIKSGWISFSFIKNIKSKIGARDV